MLLTNGEQLIYDFFFFFVSFFIRFERPKWANTREKMASVCELGLGLSKRTKHNYQSKMSPSLHLQINICTHRKWRKIHNHIHKEVENEKQYTNNLCYSKAFRFVFNWKILSSEYEKRGMEKQSHLPKKYEQKEKNICGSIRLHLLRRNNIHKINNHLISSNWNVRGDFDIVNVDNEIVCFF